MMSFIKRTVDIEFTKRRILEIEKNIQKAEAEKKKLRNAIDDARYRICSLEEDISDMKIVIFCYQTDIEDYDEYIEEATSELERYKNYINHVKIRASDKTRPACEKNLNTFV